ncbi:metallophosphoesterase [Candidatus Pacearchaeota archaeon]|nr:metallophosphoesterase [Candidatus Pacearchaeota archaeon]
MKSKKTNNIKIQYLHDCILIQNQILVIGDIHIGYDEHFDGRAIFPGMQLDEIIDKLNGIFSYLKSRDILIKKIILLGDVKHDFGQISDIEWRETLQFLDFLKKNSEEVVVIRGNHDTILEPILYKRDIKLRDFYKLKINGKNICFLHGNKLFKQCLDKQTAYLFFGHLHPAIVLEDPYKSEKFKCFLEGTWKNKQVFVLPSFSSWSYGYEITEPNDRKFFVIDHKTLLSFNVILYDSREQIPYNFGKVKNFR